MRLTFTFPFVLLAFGSFALSAFAVEPLGVVRVEDITLRPQGYFKEGKEGEFELGESSAALSWRLDHQLSSHFRFGAASLRGKPLFYDQNKNQNDLDLLEAYGEYEGLLGRIRLGLIPLELGQEGVLKDSELIFPRSQIYSRGIFGLRDFGLNYFITYNRFFTGITVHNGESGPNVDNKTWYTARWGYDFRKLRLEAFGQTGSTTPDSTTGSTLNVARFDPTKASKWRMGGFYADWVPSSFRMSMEVITGDVQQEKESHRFASGHMDLGQMGKRFGLFFRYNPFDPDLKKDNDALHNLSLAMVMVNPSQTSKVILMGTKSFEEGRQIPNDEVRLIWSATPLYRAPNY